MSNLQRRDFLMGAAAVAAATTATLAGTGPAVADDKPPAPIRGKEGASIIGPTNPAREAQNTHRLAPPKTDHGTMPNLRFSFADVHNRLQPGGWARQVTGRELQIAQALNCVNMRLKAGAVRELHWHVPDEWGFVLKGRVRITAVDQDGHAFQDDISEGNIWNFPGGIPHSLQGLEGDGCEFLLVFNDGNFSEAATFLVTDFLAHIPTEVLAKNFGVPESAFANIPKSVLAKVPTSKTPVVPA